MHIYAKAVLFLVVYALVPFVLKRGLEYSKLNTNELAKKTGGLLMSLPRPVMMILMAIPEQVVMMAMEPKMPILQRLLVSIAMYAIHFAWNGMVMKPERSYNELVWIVGTALYAFQVLGVRKQTAIALVAADSVMTLALRGLA